MKAEVTRDQFIKFFNETIVLATAQEFGSSTFKPTELARKLLVKPAALLAGSLRERDDREEWARDFGSSVVCPILDRLASQAKILKKSRGEYCIR